MAVEVRLPKLSDEMVEATISRWLKSVGDSVDKGEPVVEVETEKVIVEVEAPRAGVIVEIIAHEQDVVPVDGLICRIDEAGKRASRAKAPARDAEVRGAPPPQAPEIPPDPGSNVVPMVQRSAQGTAEAAAEGAALRSSQRLSVVASPLARRVAEELRIDLTAVEGTGIGGKIVMADLQPLVQALELSGGLSGENPPPSPRTAPPPGDSGATAANPQTAPARPAPVTPRGGTLKEIPHSALRRTIARRMSEAKGGIPHFYMTAEVDLTQALALRGRLNESLEEGRISVNDMMVKAAALALEQTPELNGFYGGDALQRSGEIHIGIATSIEEGLVTPVVRDCHLKSIGRIARDSHALIEKARRRELAPQDVQGGTFTLSNLGMYPVVEFSAIINPPQVGILAIARPVERPVADNGRVAFRRMLNATLSADHRAVDGVTGARFLAAFQAVLERPERLML